MSAFGEQQSWALPPACSSKLCQLGKAKVQKEREKRPRVKKQQRDPKLGKLSCSVQQHGSHSCPAEDVRPMAQGHPAQRATSRRAGLNAVMRCEDLTWSQASLTQGKLLSPCPPCLSNCKLLTPPTPFTQSLAQQGFSPLCSAVRVTEVITIAKTPQGYHNGDFYFKRIVSYLPLSFSIH